MDKILCLRNFVKVQIIMNCVFEKKVLEKHFVIHSLTKMSYWKEPILFLDISFLYLMNRNLDQYLQKDVQLEQVFRAVTQPILQVVLP